MVQAASLFVNEIIPNVFIEAPDSSGVSCFFIRHCEEPRDEAISWIGILLVDIAHQERHTSRMASFPMITINTPRQRSRNVRIELNVDQFERLAANFGFFSKEFLESLDRAESDYRNGKVRKVKSLRFLRWR